MKTFAKDPTAVLDYCWDWTEWLGLDTISLADIETSERITVNSFTIDEGKVTAWLSGGTVGIPETVTCTITTAGGRIDSRSVLFDMQER